MRRGMAYFHLGEYKLSIDDFNQALRIVPTSSGSDQPNLDQEKIKLYLNRAEKGLQDQNKALQKRKHALQKAFGTTASDSSTSASTSNPRQEKNKEHWNKRDILLLTTLIFLVAIAVFIGYIQRR